MKTIANAYKKQRFLMLTMIRKQRIKEDEEGEGEKECDQKEDEEKDDRPEETGNEYKKPKIKK